MTQSLLRRAPLETADVCEPLKSASLVSEELAKLARVIDRRDRPGRAHHRCRHGGTATCGQRLPAPTRRSLCADKWWTGGEEVRKRPRLVNWSLGILDDRSASQDVKERPSPTERLRAPQRHGGRLPGSRQERAGKRSSDLEGCLSHRARSSGPRPVLLCGRGGPWSGRSRLRWYG